MTGKRSGLILEVVSLDDQTEAMAQAQALDGREATVVRLALPPSATAILLSVRPQEARPERGRGQSVEVVPGDQPLSPDVVVTQTALPPPPPWPPRTAAATLAPLPEPGSDD